MVRLDFDFPNELATFRPEILASTENFCCKDEG